MADPAAVRLNGPKAVYSLLIHGQTAAGATIDLTHAATYRTLDPKVATVNDAGVIRGVADGIDAGRQSRPRVEGSASRSR